MDSIISLRNVYKSYGRRVKSDVLKDINLSIEEGSFSSIIGSSGSGKTTLLNIIGTLDKPTKGEVYVDGKRIDILSKDTLAHLRNKTIGLVFQFHYLIPQYSVIENVILPHTIKRFWCDKDSRNRAEELLDLVGLLKFKNSKIQDLSGGQQQRIAIARALMNKPKIILADEPTGNLDSSSAEKVYSLFRCISTELKTTFVIATHDEKIVRKTDRVIQVKDGILY